MTTTSETVSPSEEPTTTDTETDTESDGSPDSTKEVSEPKKGTAFTGVENIVPLGAIALGLMTSGSGLMWFGRKRKDQ